MKRALEFTPFVLDRASFTMDIAVPYVTQKLNEAVLQLLIAPGTGLAANITDCPSVTAVAQGMCPALDHPPLQAPQPLSTHALSLTLDETMLMDLTLLYKDLDEDDSGSLEAEDFLNGTYSHLQLIFSRHCRWPFCTPLTMTCWQMDRRVDGDALGTDPYARYRWGRSDLDG